MALLSRVFEIGDLIIGAHDFHLSRFLLDLSNVTIAEFRTPLVPWRVIAFYVIERAVGMESSHVLAKLMNVTLHDHAGLTVRW